MKLDLQTPDFVAANAARLAELFPNCVSETRNPQTGEIKRAIDFDLLRQELAYDLVEGPQERYRLDWPGKREALALANAPIRKTLRPCKGESVDFETTRNLYLEGDNLDALKLLQETYLGKVKMFYIDPPYNTGNDFIYDDNFSISREEYENLAGARDEEGNAMFQEEKWKQNSSANGRFHSEWLSMIYPRLKLSKNLLREDGVIFISIDDGEVTNLRRVCDEVFGDQNFVAQIVWQRSKKGDSKLVAKVHEYVLCYCRNKTACIAAGVWRQNKEGADEVLMHYASLRSEFGSDHDRIRQGMTEYYRSLPKFDPRASHKHYNWSDDRGLYFADNFAGPDDGRASRPRHDILHPVTGKPCKKPSTGWRWDQKKTDWALEQVPPRIHFGPDETTIPNRKSYLNEISTEPYSSVFYQDGRSATLEVESLVGKGLFQFPKNREVIMDLVNLVGCEDDIVLDFFSGSATTAHAVMQLNAEDGGKRRHIMVQLPEPCDEKSAAFKAGYASIAEIGKERIRRAGKKIRTELEDKLAKELKGSEEHTSLKSRLDSLDTGFRVLKIDSSNMADVYYQPDELTQDTLSLHVDNLKPGRSPEDLLFQVLLDWGVDFALPITEEKILKHRVFFVAENALAACFDTGLDEAFVKELAKRQPLRAVFRDSGYANDAVKINFEQIFKALSPHTELKTL